MRSQPGSHAVAARVACGRRWANWKEFMFERKVVVEGGGVLGLGLGLGLGVGVGVGVQVRGSSVRLGGGIVEAGGVLGLGLGVGVGVQVRGSGG